MTLPLSKLIILIAQNKAQTGCADEQRLDTVKSMCWLRRRGVVCWRHVYHESFVVIFDRMAVLDYSCRAR